MKGLKDERIRRSGRQLRLLHDGSARGLHRNSPWHYSCGWLGLFVRNCSCLSHLPYRREFCRVEAVGLGLDETKLVALVVAQAPSLSVAPSIRLDYD